MDVISHVKTWLLLHVLLGYVFVASGLIVCLLMLIAYLLLWRVNKTWYRKAVVNLAYTHWCQLTCLAQWWASSEVTVYVENKDDIALLGKEHVLVLMNHKYDIDWLMTWILAERFQMLGSSKIYGKSSLKMVPLIGWAWMFTESIFLKREWEADKRIISHDLKYITEYPENYWVNLLLFCEGTRFTESKRLESMEVARQKGLPELQHHLLPRTRGFVLSMHGLRGKLGSILDLTIGFREDSAADSLMSIIQGKSCKAEIYVRRIPFESVPMETDAECAAWLHKLFREKDKIYDKFLKNGRHYPMGHVFMPPRRYNDLIISLAWIILLSVPLFYYLGAIFISGSFYVQLGFIALFVLGSVGVRAMIAVTEIHRGSSYGKTDHQHTNGMKKD